MSSSSLAYRWDGGGDRRSLWLIASVAVNLVFAGLIVAWEFGGAPAHQAQNIQQDAVAAMSPADVAVVKATGEKFRASGEQYEKLFVPQYVKLAATLRAPYDRAKLDDVLMGVSSLVSGQDLAIHRMFADEMEALSPEGRAHIAEGYDKAIREGRLHPH